MARQATEQGSHTVWLNDRDRIASFHPVEGYYKRTFSSHDFFMSFLHALQEPFKAVCRRKMRKEL